VGRVGKPHGIRGEVTVVTSSDYPTRFAPGQIVTTDEESPRGLRVVASRRHRDGLLVSFAGVGSREAAEELRGCVLTIAATQRRPLDVDEVWPDEMTGMVVFDPERNRLGVVTGMILGSHQDRLVVTTEHGKTVEVPFVDPIVSQLHPSGGFIVVDAPPGLF